MATSLQPGVRESGDFDSRLAAFRRRERVLRSFSTDHSRGQSSVAIAEIAMGFFSMLNGSMPELWKLSLRLIIQQSDFTNILYCPVSCYTEKIN